jgi:ABC-type amino acid transport substrate-binding protein
MKNDIECRFIEMEDYTDVLEAVAMGKVDAGLTNRFYGINHEDAYAVEKSPLIYSAVELRFAAPKDKRPALLQTIDAHLSALKNVSST